MATPPTGTSPTGKSKDANVSQQELEAEIAKLREDIAKLSEQIATTGEKSYTAARHAANEKIEELRAKGEETVEQLRDSADDIEKQVTAHVRAKPVTSLAVAAGIGYLFALITSR